MNKKNLYFILTILCILFIIIQGCGKNTDNSSKNGKEDINLKPGKMTITDENGKELVIDNEKIPKNFPSDIPIYPASILQYSMKSEDTNVMTISLESKDSVDKIEAFYKKELEDKKWKIENVFTTEKSSMFTGKKKEKTINIAITKGAKKTNNISISLSEEK